jgi:hypothetical protein
MDDVLVQMKATTFFTRNSPSTGAILHGDPRTNADVIARFPKVSEADAAYLEDEGLAEPFDGSLPKSRGPGPAETVDERAARLAEEHTEADQSVEVSTGLDTRGSTVFERPVHQLAGKSGGAAPVLKADDNRRSPPSSDDAPPGRGNGKTGATEPKPYAQMKTAELEAEAAKDPPVDLSEAKNNEERAKLLEKARGGKAPAVAQ